jgi:hypothetical protein
MPSHSGQRAQRRLRARSHRPSTSLSVRFPPDVPRAASSVWSHGERGARGCAGERCGRDGKWWGYPATSGRDALDLYSNQQWGPVWPWINGRTFSGNPCIRSPLSPGSGTAWASSRGRSRVRIGRDQSVHMAQAAITDRDDIDPADYRLTGRPDTPRQRGGVGPNVGGPSSSCTKPARGPSSSF